MPKIKTLSFTGHRPQSLPIDCWLVTGEGSKLIGDKLLPFLIHIIQEEKVRTFMSGGALGFDQIAFWTVEKLKALYPEINIMNTVIVPYADQPNKWDKEQQYWYDKMLKRADEVIYTDRIEEYQMIAVEEGKHHDNKLFKRNYYLVDHCDILFSLWNGKHSGTGRTVQYGLHQGIQIWQMNPQDDFKIKMYAEENRR